jgi:hypothetical protein
MLMLRKSFQCKEKEEKKSTLTQPFLAFTHLLDPFSTAQLHNNFTSPFPHFTCLPRRLYNPDSLFSYSFQLLMDLVPTSLPVVHFSCLFLQSCEWHRRHQLKYLIYIFMHSELSSSINLAVCIHLAVSFSHFA